MPFEFEPTDIPDVLLVTAARLHDARGYFREAAFHDHGIDLRGERVPFATYRCATVTSS